MARTSFIVIASALRPAGTVVFPAQALPVGTSAITVSVDRTLLLDPALQVGWALELSVDGGVSWLPWGAATAVGGPIIPNPKNPTGESNFSTTFVRRLSDGSIEPGFEPSNAGRLVRGSLTGDRQITTKVTVTLDDAPVPLVIATPPPHQSVSFDNFNTFDFSAVSSATTSAFAITAAANRAGLLGLSTTDTVGTGPSGSIGGVAGAAISGTDSGIGPRTLFFGVIAPPSGSQTATMSWTGNSSGTLGVATVSGADQTAPFINGTFATGVNPVAVTITSNPGDLTFSVAAVSASVLSAPTQTQVYNHTSAFWGAMSRGSGAGTETHSWTGTGAETDVISGVNVVQMAAGGGGGAAILMGQAML